MKTTQITYETSNPVIGSKVIDYIKSHRYWARVMEGVWIIRSDKECPQVRNELYDIIKDTGRIFTSNITYSAWATSGLPDEVNKWLKQ